MISIRKYFFRQFILAALVGYLLFFTTAFITAYQQTLMISKQAEIVLNAEFEKKRDKLLLFFTLNDSVHFLEQLNDIQINNSEYQICSDVFSTKQKQCSLANYFIHPSEPRIKIFFQLQKDVFYKTLTLSVFSITNFIFLFLLTILAIITHSFLRHKIIQPIIQLNSFLDNFSEKNIYLGIFNTNSNLLEWQQVEKNIKAMLDKIKSLENKLISDTTILVATQVSHDIRSPLSALTMMLGQITVLPETHRIIMRNAITRITDIANELLSKYKDNVSQLSSDNASTVVQRTMILKNELLSPLIESLVSEKRVQFREKQNIEIVADLDQGYGMFANINTTELKRTISNLLNNSIEAIPDAKGRIIVSIRGYSDLVCIIIQDNGKGIPHHIIDKLGQQGVSYGKERSQSGSGLGIYHAKKTIEAFNGRFDISSREGAGGTTISMCLPRVQAPKWFVDKISLKPHQKVISIDDDLSIHGIWKDRFESKKLHEIGLEHLTFTSVDEFKNWYSKNQELNSSRLYLVDFELYNQKHTGLEIIEQLSIGSQSILVTSKYEEDHIREKCDQLGVRLIPKAMAGFVPIEVENPKEKIG